MVSARPDLDKNCLEPERVRKGESWRANKMCPGERMKRPRSPSAIWGLLSKGCIFICVCFGLKDHCLLASISTLVSISHHMVFIFSLCLWTQVQFNLLLIVFTQLLSFLTCRSFKNSSLLASFPFLLLITLCSFFILNHLVKVKTSTE